jgi:hypothetical protein
MLLDDIFIKKVREQVLRNRNKWNPDWSGRATDRDGHHDFSHDQNPVEWLLILNEQVGQLNKAMLEGNKQEILKEIIHAAAPLYELYELFEGEWNPDFIMKNTRGELFK